MGLPFFLLVEGMRAKYCVRSVLFSLLKMVMLIKTEDPWSNVTGISRYGFNRDSIEKIPYLNILSVFKSPNNNIKHVFSCVCAAYIVVILTLA